MAPSRAEAPAQIRPLAREDLGAVMDLFGAEDWRSYADDEERTWRALNAPGTLTLVAARGDEVLGVGQTLCDGEIQAFLSILLVAADARRTGIGRALVAECLRRTPGVRLDLISVADDFYGRLGFEAVSAVPPRTCRAHARLSSRSLRPLRSTTRTKSLCWGPASHRLRLSSA